MVRTHSGLVLGSELRTVQGKRIYSYRGLPYARPPLGRLRFQRPEPATPWEGVKDCSKEGRMSLQPNALMPNADWLGQGSEDCLLLSVFTKTGPGKGMWGGFFGGVSGALKTL